MAPRASWKGFLKIAEIGCAVALYPASSTSDRIGFHTLNRKTGNRVRRIFVDSGTGKPVDPDDQVKGYETAAGDHIMLDPDEIEAALPDNDKTLSVSAFVGCDDIDDLYFDKPYYIAHADPGAIKAFALIRDGMRAEKVAALAQTVLFRRARTVLIRAHHDGLIGTTLNFAYEVRDPAQAFAHLPDTRTGDEMLDLACALVATRRGAFDPGTVVDRYEDALADLVRAKAEGRRMPPPREPAPCESVDLLAALRDSAARTDPARRPAKPRGAPRTARSGRSDKKAG